MLHKDSLLLWDFLGGGEWEGRPVTLHTYDQSLFSSSTLWAPGIELRLPGLAAGSLIH